MDNLSRIRPAAESSFKAGAALGVWLVSFGLGSLAVTTAAAQTTANEAEAGEGAAAGDEAELLDVIEVRAAGATTEGSGSFAASEASIGRGIGSTQDLPQTVTVVTQRVLEERNLTTLDSAMTETPGIVAKTEGYGFPSFYSRGFIIDNYQIDELSTSYTSGFRPDFDMALYDRLEVLRGAEALFSGAGEPGGTINLARKRPTGSFAASGALSYGSWDNRRIEADIGGPLAFDGRLRGRAIGVAQDQEFFYSPSDEKKHVAYGILEYDLTPLTLVTAGASYQRQNGVTWQQGLPTFDDGTMLGLPRDVALTADWATREQTVKEVFASVEHAFTPDWTAKLSAMRQDFDFDYLNLNVGGPVYAATGAFRDSTSGSESDGNTSKIIDASLSGAFDAWGRRHGLLVGANWQESHGSQLRYLVEPGVLPGALTIDDFPNPDLPKPEVLGLSYGWPEWGSKQRGIYGRLNLEATQRMNVILGARYADYRYSDTSQSYDENGDPFDTSTVGYEDNGIFVPYLGVTYALTPAWTAYASLSETYVPQANYLSGPPDAATPLDAITGRNYEVGVKGLLMGGVLTGSAALYRIERDGEAVEDSRYVPTGGFASCCYVAQGEVVSQGVELELAGELAPGWQVFGGYTYNDNQNKTENAVYSEFTPKHLLKLWTSYDLPRDYSRWTVGGGVTAMSGQANSGLAWIYDANAGWSQEPFRIEQGGYAVWDAFAQYRIAEGWDLALNVNNVFDRTYYATLGTPTGGNWYGQPRTAYLTLRARF
ncbi:MAG: TonB-dependent siderophore receptor [Rhodovulum sulfidophilum]|uniref:TonB-dependent siderophore receptor n=1 Tax=Rhodovulum sulfidophilum TaxID=35806 RepID=A0A2W5N969_RHOSU|nr:MAG: TonB-dependent siderophore receptor [Rhodovulum sulfidophilum]